MGKGIPETTEEAATAVHLTAKTSLFMWSAVNLPESSNGVQVVGGSNPPAPTMTLDLAIYPPKVFYTRWSRKTGDLVLFRPPMKSPDWHTPELKRTFPVFTYRGEHLSVTQVVGGAAFLLLPNSVR